MEIVPFDTGDIRNRTRERLSVDDLKGRWAEKPWERKSESLTTNIPL